MGAGPREILIALAGQARDGAFREFYLLQKKLADEGRDAEARALADDLWNLLAAERRAADGGRARLFHDFAVLLGSPGPAADLSRARELFARARAFWADAGEEADVARSRHNEANALQNLGTTAEDLEAAIALYERALVFRTDERAIARGVTLHNMGAALRKLAALSEDPAPLLGRSEEALEEAIAIREAEGLEEGLALSWFQLGLTLDASAAAGRRGALAAARAAFEASASAHERVGRPEEAAVARRCALDASVRRPL